LFECWFGIDGVWGCVFIECVLLYVDGVDFVDEDDVLFVLFVGELFCFMC